MIFNCASIVMVIILGIAILLFIVPIRVKSNGIIMLWYVFILALAVFAFYAEPSVSDDLFRHYNIIQQFRDGTTSIFRSPLIVWNIILWLISLTANNGWLPFATVLIWGILVGEIVKSYLKTNQYRTRSIIIYFVSALGGCSVFYIISGIRNALVVAIWAYAYFCHYQNKRKYFYYALCLIIFGMHTVTLLLIGLNLLYEYAVRKVKTKSIAMMIAPVFLIGLALNSNFLEAIAGIISSPYLNLIVSKFTVYREQYLIADRWMIENQIKLVALIVLLCFELYLYRKKHEKLSFNLFLIFCTLAMSSMPIFFERLFYLISVLSFSTINGMTEELTRWKRTFVSYIAMAVFSGQLFFAFYEMFAHISFNGIYYRDMMRQIFFLD